LSILIQYIDLARPKSGAPLFFAGTYQFGKILSFKSLNKKRKRIEKEKTKFMFPLSITTTLRKLTLFQEVK